MERQSNMHSPRLDEAMQHEVESLTRGAPIEARAEPEREMEGAGDGEPDAEPIVDEIEAPAGPSLSHAEVRARSDLAMHLRPSIFPADRDELVACALEEGASPAVVAQLEQLPPGERYVNVARVWEALGGHHEERTTAPAPPQRFEFAFDRVHHLLGMPFGVMPRTAAVVVDRARGELDVRFGMWHVHTRLDNVTGASVTGPYTTLKTAGPAHLSLADRGLTFATNDRAGVCIQFREPVRGIDPFGAIRHPGLTVTVSDPDALRAALVHD